MKKLLLTTISMLTLGAAISAHAGGELSIAEEIAQLKKRIDILSTKMDQRKGADLGSFENISFKSNDGLFSAKFAGQLQTDLGIFNDDEVDHPDSTSIRRAEFAVSGKLHGDWGYKLKFDFAKSGVDLQDVYVTYKGLKNAETKIGQYKEPFLFDYLTSSTNTSFMERATVKDAFSFGRRIGLSQKFYGDNWSLIAGVFGDKARETSSDDEQYSVTTRATYAPINNEDSLIHLGLAGSYRTPNQGDKTTKLRSRAENSFTSARAVDTGTISDVDNIKLLGLEFAGRYKSLHLQGEYVSQSVDTIAQDYNFSGYYGQVSYFLTGEYKPYKASKGAFKRIKPANKFSLKDGGIGAWELAARYSYLDLTDGAILGGELSDYTLGVNWYPNSKIRFMANYVISDSDENSVIANDDPEIFTLRAQVLF